MLRKGHLRMRIAPREQQSIRVRETGGNHGFEPRVEAADECGQRAPTRAASGSKSCRVYFGPADEVIDGSFGVPDIVSGQPLAYQAGLRPRVDVLISRPARCGRFQLRIVSLLSFALARRVERERYETFQREVCRQQLRLRL